MSSTTEPIRVAVIDDYTSTSRPHFDKLPEDTSLNLKVDYIPETLNSRDPSQLPDQITRLKPYHIISTMRERTWFTRDLLSALPNLKLILTTGLYNAAIDLAAANEIGITVLGAKTAKANSTNELNWALILAVAKRIPDGDRRIKAGGWQDAVSLSLEGKKLGLLGLGRLGTECAVTGKFGFGMDVIAWSTNLTQEKADKVAASRGMQKGAIRVTSSKDELFKEADVLSIHYVLSQRSVGIVGEKELRLMKKDAILINTSRGPLVDEKALVEALREKRIRGAGLDVYDLEPLPADSVWRNQEWGGRVVTSPHTGYLDEESMNGWYEKHADDIRRWIKGKKVIDPLQVKSGT